MRSEYVLLLVVAAFLSPASSIKASSKATNMSNAAVAAASRHAVGKIDPKTTALLLCDVQERFRSLIWNAETVISTCRYMTSVAKALDVPVVATQQYTKVFGETVKDCFASEDELAAIALCAEKKQFSMLTDEVRAKLAELNKKSYIIVGIEAHVCVQQTCLDLLEQGADVHVVCDAVSSQQQYDREIALRRLGDAGAFLTTAQSLAFMLMRSADHPNFKTVSKLTVEHMKLPNAFNEPSKL